MEPFNLTFMILGTGLGISTLVFVLELLTFKLNNHDPSENELVEVAGKHGSGAESNHKDAQIKHDVLTRGDNSVVLPGVVAKEDDIEVIETKKGKY